MIKRVTNMSFFWYHAAWLTFFKWISFGACGSIIRFDGKRAEKKVTKSNNSSSIISLARKQKGRFYCETIELTKTARRKNDRWKQQHERKGNKKQQKANGLESPRHTWDQFRRSEKHSKKRKQRCLKITSRLLISSRERYSNEYFLRCPREDRLTLTDPFIWLSSILTRKRSRIKWLFEGANATMTPN